MLSHPWLEEQREASTVRGHFSTELDRSPRAGRLKPPAAGWLSLEQSSPPR